MIKEMYKKSAMVFVMLHISNKNKFKSVLIRKGVKDHPNLQIYILCFSDNAIQFSALLNTLRDLLCTEVLILGLLIRG